MQITTTSTLYAIWEGRRYPVTDVHDAARKWDYFRQQSNAGVSEIGNGLEVQDDAGACVARISYNSRIWTPDGAAWASSASI